MRESLRDQLLIGGTREARSQAKAPLDLIVWDSIATIELCETFLDFRQEHQPLNGIVDRSIWRQFANRMPHRITRDQMVEAIRELLAERRDNVRLVGSGAP